jgi:hypothetical protein
MADNPLPTPDISGYGKVEPTKGFDKEPNLKPPNAEAFQSYMKEPTPKAAEESAERLSPMDLAKANMPRQAAPSLDNFLGQIQGTTSQIENMQNNLASPNLRFKSSQARLLESKLGDAKSHIASASQKLGAPLVPDAAIPPGSGPVFKFISMLTDGQRQLLAAKAQVEKFKSKGEALAPGDMLLIQIKLSQAQQEIEYSSILLSKVVDIITKTINIQI